MVTSDRSHITGNGEFPWKFLLGHFPQPCSVRVRVRSGVRVRVGSVGLGLRLVELVLGLKLGLGLWFGSGECPGGEMSRGNIRHSILQQFRTFDAIPACEGRIPGHNRYSAILMRCALVIILQNVSYLYVYDFLCIYGAARHAHVLSACWLLRV